MARDEVRELIVEQFGARRRLVALTRLTGGSKKGVYRLALDDGTTVVLYRWAGDENYWPAGPAVPDDPFVDASGADLFQASHAALSSAGVRVPRLITLRPHVALVEDAGGTTLEELMRRDPAAAAAPLAALGEALRRMHTTFGPRYGKVAETAPRGMHTTLAPRYGKGAEAALGGEPQRPAEDVILDRALAHLDAAATRDRRIANARPQITEHLRGLHRAVSPRHSFALIHGELGPDHVLVTPDGEPVLIDIEGVSYFDVEWEHAFLRLRFGETYESLHPVACDPQRLALYLYAQTLSLIEGPLRLATTDFPHRQWMLNLAEHNITTALAALHEPPIARPTTATTDSIPQRRPAKGL